MPNALYDLLFVTFDGLILRDIHTNGLFLNLLILCAFCEGWNDGITYFVRIHIMFFYYFFFFFLNFLSPYFTFSLLNAALCILMESIRQHYFWVFLCSIYNILLINYISSWTNLFIRSTSLCLTKTYIYICNRKR